MISKEAYKILHGIDSSPDQATIHLNWLNVKADDPRLIKVRKILKATERPEPKKEKVIVHRKDTYKYDDAGILKMIKKGCTSAQIAKTYGFNRNTMYAHIKKTPALKESYEKSVREFKTIIAIKNGKKCATGSLNNLSKKLRLKRASVDNALLANQKLFGYRFMRLRDWRKNNGKA